MRRNNLAILGILVFSLTVSGCQEKKAPSSSTHSKPWLETADSSALLESDSLALLEADSIARADSIAHADSIARADSLARVSAARSPHQVLQGTAGSAQIYLNFSSIDGTHVVGNATINGQPYQMAGRYDEHQGVRSIHLTETTRDKKVTPWKIDASATPEGFEGTFTKAHEHTPLTLTRMQ